MLYKVGKFLFQIGSIKRHMTDESDLLMTEVSIPNWFD